MKKIRLGLDSAFRSWALALLAVLLLLPGSLQAAGVTMAWDPVFHPDLAGYKIYYGPSSGSYSTTIDVGLATTYEVTGLSPGVYYLAVTAYDRWNRESGYSNELAVEINAQGEIVSVMSVSPSGANPYTGWWYVPQESGSGISVEVQGSLLFLAWYTYDEYSGQPIWLTSGGVMSDPSSYYGPLLQWSGWPLGGDYLPPQSIEVGTIGISFLSSNQALVTWSLDSKNGQKTFKKFLEDFSPGDPDPRNLKGWWYEPGREGMGVFLECQGGSLFMAWYHYDDTGFPRWWSSGGPFPAGTELYSGRLEEWGNGPCLSCPYTPPDSPPQDMGTVTIRLVNDSQAVLTWEGGQVFLSRFQLQALP